MKTFDEIRNNRRFQSEVKGEDGGRGWLTIRGRIFRVVYSNGGGWDHVCASMENRCPTWEEMCEIKDVFFGKDECCVEYHPAENNYVNVHPYCLHIWRPQKEDLPKPPMIFV